METATFVKVRELSLSYSLPDKLCVLGGQWDRSKDARLSLTGRDLFAWFRYTGLDPEVNFVGNTQSPARPGRHALSASAQLFHFP